MNNWNGLVKCIRCVINGHTFDIDKRWVSCINNFNLIYIGNNKGKDSFTLNKTEILKTGG